MRCQWTVHAVSLTPHAEFKKSLARESRTQGVLFDEKTEGRKSRDTVPLMKNSR
jgi:hypothetical protein